MKSNASTALAVIFDMDGVIVDSEPLFDTFTAKYCKELGINLSSEHLESFRGRTSKSLWEFIKEEFGLQESVEELVKKARDAYFAHLLSYETIEPVVGVKDLILQLKETYRLAVASSASPRRINFLLEKTRLKQFFEITVSADDVEYGKPAPDLYLKVAGLLGVEPLHCVVIEDAKNGIESGHNAGMKVIGFAGLLHNKQDLSKADIIVKSFSEISEDLIVKL